MRVASEGIKISFFILALSIIPFYFGFWVIGTLTLAIAVGVLFFFRDPERDINGDGVISPADGRVMAVKEVDGRPVVCIFLSIFDVHINRVPLSGVVTGVTHHPGSYVPAFKKESEKNERNEVELETGYGEFKVVQIAGFSARRIRCYLKPGDEVVRGSKMGLIAFSSRVDLYFPRDFDSEQIEVSVDDTVTAGVTKLAELSD
ncbi:phosphatidylserine decarboxylase [Methanonatronarchaeum sp. AMET6-2]|uniref:phosphatidylserine decarboxylase n=1 Tax=Methanonatronarchaeum sp. AMET6-2 TaxID=2933293 RepID=UPI001FF2C364|nr:phosphatidylserine decarboxylase [Methanonatronarchaeum sp. AMET6-2]UOY10435.1 phosphatidylserine decarboxylase [Methanonatronarchaeum sp. AMET6-2]